MMRLVITIVSLFAVSLLPAATPPNVVFLLADDMNRDSWGVYGNPDCRTPHIDRLASEGLRFERAYCSVAMCAPFRQELYSGRTPWRTGTLHNHSRSHPDTKSLPHYLKPLGYRVALIGKSHVGPGKAYPFEHFGGGDKSKDKNPLYLQQAGAFMDSCAEDNKPFCMVIASNDSHAPFTTGDRSQYRAADLTVPPYWLDTPETRDEMVKYYAEVSNFDALVGSVRAELEARELWDKTIFMVCSEQGTQLPFAKWTCYDNGLHIGLVAHWHGVTKPGSIASELVTTTDVAPTLVEAAGGRFAADDFDGKSFLKTLRGEPQVLHDAVVGAFTNCNIIDNRQRVYPIRVIRDKQCSLIYNPNHADSVTSNVTLTAAHRLLSGEANKQTDVAASWVPLASKTNSRAAGLVHKLHHRPEWELYNRGVDPYELKNEIDNPEYATVAKRLKAQLRERLAALGDADPIATEKRIIANKVKKR